MQIIGGRASGIRILVPHGDSVRPTSGAARKALFDSVANFADIAVADIFAGSGALGLEAASRGAAEVTFIEIYPKNCAMIRENIEKVLKAGAAFRHQIIKSDVFSLFRKTPSIPSPDIIFSDPPYADSVESLEKLLKNANFAEWAAKATLIWETPDFKSDFTEAINGSLWKLDKIKKFGGREFLFLKIISAE